MIERGDKIDVFMSVQYSHEETGGVQRWALEAKPWIELKTGGKVVVTFPKKKTDDESTIPEGCHFLGKVSMLTLQHHDNRYQVSGWVNPKDVQKICLLENITLDIAHIQEPFPGGYPTGTPGVIKGLPKTKDGMIIPGVVIHCHAAIDNLTRKTRFFTHGVKALGYHANIMKKADRTLAVSQATIDTWSQFWPVDYDIVPNGINTEELKPDVPIIRERKRDGKKTILFAGRHDRRKGIEDLLLAYRYLRESGRNDIQLRIAGNGYMTEELKKMIRDLEIPDVEFLGNLSRENLVKAYRTADVFVGPSRDGEAFNRTDAEALSCGTMVVTTNISGHRYAFGEAKGGVFFVKPNDPDELARGIVTVLDLSEEDRRKLGGQGREHIVENYSWPNVIEKKLIPIYVRVVKAKRDKLASSGKSIRGGR